MQSNILLRIIKIVGRIKGKEMPIYISLFQKYKCLNGDTEHLHT